MLNDTPIRISSLVKDYGSLRAVSDVSFHLERGEIFGLLGPNGAGKTSIISTLVTLEAPTSGTVEIFGVDVTKNPKVTKSLTGFVPQELIHHGYFDVREILEFHSGYFGRRRNGDRIDYLLDRLSLAEHAHKKVKQLSGGMKRRLLIAKALVHEPKLLLLDEPTAGVDIELRSSLWKFVAELKGEGMSILLTTHYIQEAEELCDRVGILQGGQLKTIGRTRELIKGLTTREVALTLKPGASTIEHRCLIKVRDLPEGQGREMILRIPAQREVGELLSELNMDIAMIKDISVREGNLEDALRRVLEGV
ncbi:MAG: ABC transporter ATP-binding protein [Bdellovibrionaceae bacterium]|nr:ABC transporter ATP-binding protein [Pseudobdellovibrionaceae bacterium]